MPTSFRISCGEICLEIVACLATAGISARVETEEPRGEWMKDNSLHTRYWIDMFLFCPTQLSAWRYTHFPSLCWLRYSGESDWWHSSLTRIVRLGTASLSIVTHTKEAFILTRCRRALYLLFRASFFCHSSPSSFSSKRNCLLKLSYFLYTAANA